ncbi:MAG: hypothetical protein OEZ32_07405 [Nitrospinota bacterium]|nr:hypothetical protein [Nitrospinota bacterium]
MSNAVTTTVQITFGDAADNKAHLSAEVDKRPNGLNGGKTSFIGGDPVHVLVYKSHSVSITGVEVSAGTIHTAERQLVEVEDVITFAGKRDASLSRPASGPLQVTWFGRSLGGLAVGEDGVSVIAGSEGVAVARVRYKAYANAYRISTPTAINQEKNYSLLFFVTGLAN